MWDPLSVSIYCIEILQQAGQYWSQLVFGICTQLYSLYSKGFIMVSLRVGGFQWLNRWAKFFTSDSKVGRYWPLCILVPEPQCLYISKALIIFLSWFLPGRCKQLCSVMWLPCQHTERYSLQPPVWGTVLCSKVSKTGSNNGSLLVWNRECLSHI